MFEVWAPLVGRVTLLLDGTRHPMERIRDGWWQLGERRTGRDAPIAAAAEHDYGYLLDDEATALPDPRSRHQPNTVHGLSRTFHAERFPWSDQHWTGRQLAGGVVYELHLGTFTHDGTADSAIDRLDHLVALGIDFVEVLPVNAFEGPYNWGYDGVAWYAVDESYGGPAGYLRLVDACHRRGLGVIQDVVYNHLGPSGNYLPRFGPYLHASSANTWGASVNFDQPQVRSYVVDNALMWMRDYHVDGLRLDAVHALVDHSSKHILQELAEETDAASAAVGRPLSLIAESDLNDPVIILPREAGGYGVHAQWSDDFHHAVHVALTAETTGYYADFASPSALPKVLTRGFFHDGTYSSFRGRRHGHPIDVERMPAWRLVAYDQNHDQIGNRAAGDRLSAVLDEGRLAIAAVLTLTGPFTPMLFMGEEWGASTPWQYFTAFTDPELGEATARGRLTEFERMGWDPTVVPHPQDRSTFERSKLDWSELADGEHARLFELYRALIRLRRSLPDLTDPRLDRVACEVDEAEHWVIVHRGGSTVVVNLGTDIRRLPVTGTVLLSTDAAVLADSDGTTLPGHSAAVLTSATS